MTVIHEACGHGLACELVGGKALAVSSTELRCDGPEDGARLAVTAAGSIANILVGLAAFAAGIALGPARSVWAYGQWLFGATNLFHAGMYLLIGPLTGFGDWSYVARKLKPELVWIVGITALGLLLLVRLPSWPERDPPDPPVRIASWAWVVAGMVSGLGFVLVLGQGLG